MSLFEVKPKKRWAVAQKMCSRPKASQTEAWRKDWLITHIWIKSMSIIYFHKGYLSDPQMEKGWSRTDFERESTWISIWSEYSPAWRPREAYNGFGPDCRCPAHWAKLRLLRPLQKVASYFTTIADICGRSCNCFITATTPEPAVNYVLSSVTFRFVTLFVTTWRHQKRKNHEDKVPFRRIER